MVKTFWHACTAVLQAHRLGNAAELANAFRQAEYMLDHGVIDDLLHTKRCQHLERIREHVRIEEQRLTTASKGKPNGADERLFFPRPQNQVLREKLGIPRDHFVVVAVSNGLILTKKITEALGGALDILNGEGIAVTLICVSRTPITGTSIQEARIQDLGSLSPKELPDILAAGDALFCGMEIGPAGEKDRLSRLLECFAMGRPVVLPRNLAGLPVVHRSDAYVLENVSASDIAAAIRNIRMEAGLADRLASGAVNYYLSSAACQHAKSAATRSEVKNKLERPAEVKKLQERIARLEQDKHELSVRLRSMPSIDPLCLGDSVESSLMAPVEDFGIIVFGHTRLDTLGAVLESLKKQGALQYTEVWLDGYQGNHTLKCKIEKTVELVNAYPVKHLHRQAGNFGFRKMLILGLIEMSKRYRDILVLEDDCFPTRDAVAEFRRELDLIREDERIFSVYGHHFLVDSEKETCSRFQGWGWATTAEKLRPVLRQLIDCYSMTEERFLKFVSSTLTAEVKSRIDVTPPRQPSYVLENFFAWDETICLLTALNNQVHKPTQKRAIYNCGIGEDSTHFNDTERFREPPFNLITPSEVWQYF